MKGIWLSAFLFTSIVVAVVQADFQINMHTTYDQGSAGIAADRQGGFIVVWDSYRQDGDSGGVFARRFLADAVPAADEFQVNSTATGNQKEPSIAMDPTGRFVVAWQGPGPDEEDIFARLFDPNCQPLEAEFQVNEHIEGEQVVPSVAMSPDGAFVVVWESRAPQGRRSICTRLYDSSDTPIGGQFAVDDGQFDCRYPDVAVDDSGNFAVVWMQDRSTNAIFARLYDAAGMARTDPFQVNTADFRSVTRPAVATDPNGSFVVAWDGHPDLAGLDDIHARLFGPDGTALGDQFMVNTATAGSQDYPQVAVNEKGQFVVVWQGESEPGGETDIFGRRYSSVGEPIGGEFRINTYTADDQRYPDVAIRQDGTFLAIWESYGQDGSRYGVFGENRPQVATADLNRDGFVDFLDFCLLAAQWRQTGASLSADVMYDGIVDEHDFAALCRDWLTVQPQ